MTGILLIDKEQGWTSSDVVAKLRGVLREKRIGHAGTLDPLATGLLVVMVGRASRASDILMHHQKRYLAHFLPGITTDTQDITGRVLTEKPCHVRTEDLEAVLTSFCGELEQIPPMYSAIKIQGRKLYEIARRGEEVPRPPRRITVSSISLCGREGDTFLLDITCSSGTYVRTLCHDIGQKLGCGGCMTQLRRLSSGSYSVDQAHTVSEVIDASSRGEAEKLLIPVDTVFMEKPALTVDGIQEAKLRCGNVVPVSAADGEYRVYASAGAFLAVGSVQAGILKTIKNYFEVIPT